MSTRNTDPVINNSKDPLISIFIYNYEKQYLKQCLNGIFNQDTITNFEIILIDDATYNGSWDIALEYLNLYPKRITVQRNRKILGPTRNFKICLEMAKGRFYITLTNNQVFLPGYFKNAVSAMNVDLYVKFNLVYRANDPYIFVPLPPLMMDITEKPLVSILCYNYNYGRYLRQCLESIFAQTYENIELCFSDNASTDESWEIALEFVRKYPDKMYITRNRKNFGPDANFGNSRRNKQGKYYINFCSDDVLEPDYVERCVDILESNNNIGLVLVNRSIIDEKGIRTEEPPFYNQSCIIPGEKQAAVYMMAGVNPSVSQIMYRQSIVDTRTVTGGLVSRYYGTRILDFNISIDFDIAYIKDPLLQHRIHSQSDTNQADSSLMPVIGLYVLNHQFADLASVRNLKEVTDRLPKSIEKLAQLSIRYSLRSLLANDFESALRYFHLSIAMSPGLIDDPIWKQLSEYWNSDETRRKEILKELTTHANLAARSISYDPPSGSIALTVAKRKYEFEAV